MKKLLTACLLAGLAMSIQSCGESDAKPTVHVPQIPKSTMIRARTLDSGKDVVIEASHESAKWIREGDRISVVAKNGVFYELEVNSDLVVQVVSIIR